MPLSDTVIRTAKPTAKPQKLTDGGGLYLLLNPNGSRWWRWDYRHSAKRKTLSMGIYPDIGLKDARERRDAARKLLAAGIDPGEQRKAEKAAGTDRAANSFEVVAREWFAQQSPSWVEGHSSKIMARLERDIFPWIGARPIAEVTAPEILKALRRIESRGTIETAHRVLQNCGQIFRYAVATGRADRDPTPDLRGALAPVKETHHAAITEPAAIGGLLRAIDIYRGAPVTKSALMLAPLVFVRPGELRHAEWSEMDLDAALWNIPAARMKMKDAHLV